MKKDMQDTWIKPRHRIVTAIACAVLTPYCRLKYGIKIEKFKEQKDRQYLILYNHQTAFDQFFVGISFEGPIYYMATEDIFSLGWISKLLSWLVAPIPIRKQTTDIKAVKTCFRVVKEGGTICIAPEGNRSYSGKTEYMNPAIASMAKKMKMPIALYRIEGGYGVQPRWSDVLRKGKMRSYVSRVIEPEEYAKMTAEELLQEIEKELYVNEASVDGMFYHKKRAEYLERAIYVCPYCGLSVFESHEDVVECKSCGRKVTYEPTKEIKGVGFEFPFRFVNEWYEYQKKFVNELDIQPYINTPMYRDEANISEVILFQKKNPFREEASIALYGNRVVFDEGKENELLLHFDEVSAVTVLGRNKANIYYDDHVYQLKGSARFNALKYVNLYYHYKNLTKENENGEFLGL